MELSATAGLAGTVDRVLAFALQATGADCAGVVLVRHGGRLDTGGATGPRVEQADRLQVECGEGPCMPASRHEASVVVYDTTADLLWPRWSPRVAELGLRSVLAVGLFTARSTLGALNLYASVPGRFTTDDEVTARLLGLHATVAIATVRQASTLAEAVEARGLIGQAQGLLMERFALDAEQAFAVLRRYSQNNNIKLHVVAAQLITTRQLPHPSRLGRAERSGAKVTG
jgi:GAF domain-containing protein